MRLGIATKDLLRMCVKAQDMSGFYQDRNRLRTRSLSCQPVKDQSAALIESKDPCIRGCGRVFVFLQT